MNFNIFTQTILPWIFRILIYYLIFIAVVMIIPPLFRPSLAENWKDKNLATRPRSTEERVMSLETPLEAEFWRYRMVTWAEKSIDMVVFSYRKDLGGLTFTSALIEAADRGVKVRLVVDGINLRKVGMKYYSLIDNHPNIEVRIYNPISIFKPWDLNYRLHDKFIIVDDDLYLLGGRNQNSLFMGAYDDEPRKNKDRDLLVYQGDKERENSLKDLKVYFEELWTEKKTKPAKKLSQKKEDQEDYHEFEHIIWKLKRDLKDQMPEAFQKTKWEEVTVPAKRIEILRGPANASNKPALLYNLLIEKMKDGRDVIIETPYIILGRRNFKKLVNLSEDYGTKITYLTNSPESGANLVGNAEQIYNRKKIQKTGADLYEYIGPESQHTKTILIDDYISIVGTFNFDMRSIYLDTEVMVYVESEQLNEKIKRESQKRMDSSRKILPDGRVVLGPEAEEKVLGKKEKIFVKTLYVLTLPYKHLL